MRGDAPAEPEHDRKEGVPGAMRLIIRFPP
nr:MAG TPA: hypothetical protein [Caudoviricetes sp.]